MEKFFAEVLERHNSLFEKVEEGVVPTSELLRDFDRASRFDAMRISAEYTSDALQREREANEIFNSQIASGELPG